MSLNLVLQLNPTILAPSADAQIGYVLATITAPRNTATRPVNWALVADASRSMRIPIISEVQFRELVREGGAQEVLVDGVPVWQLTSPIPPAVRDHAPSAIDYIARALHSIVERLGEHDRFTLVACAEDATVVVPSTSGAERNALVTGIGKLKGLRLGETTDLSDGIRLGLAELTHGRTTTDSRAAVERLILLTDGFTQHPETCLQLVQQAAEANITVSTLGLGGEFQDDLLTNLADTSGGRATFVRSAAAIPAAIDAELNAARGVVARALTLRVRLPQRLRLRRVTRISPTLAPLDEQLQPAHQVQTLRLGDLEQDTAVRLLLEFVVPPAPGSVIASGTGRLRIAEITATSGDAECNADALLHYAPTATPAPPTVLDAAARASAVRLQQRGLALAASGDPLAAAQLLRAAAQRLRGLGEEHLAVTAETEAARLEQTGQVSSVGAKELTYATRRLGEHEAE